MVDEGTDNGKKKETKFDEFRLLLSRFRDEITDAESEEHFPVNLIIRYRKDIIRYSSMVLGALLIMAGVISIIGSSDRVVDNVVSGENTVIAAFLILTGLLLLGLSLVHSLLNGTFIDRFYREVRDAEAGDNDDGKEARSDDSGDGTLPGDAGQAGNAEAGDKDK